MWLSHAALHDLTFCLHDNDEDYTLLDAGFYKGKGLYWIAVDVI